jgi:recombination protein RecA
MHDGSTSGHRPEDSIPTGIDVLDHALGRGGIPRGNIIEIVGPPLVGKTALCLYILAEAQRRGDTVAYIAGAQGLDLDYARAWGADTAKLLIHRPTFFGEALASVVALAEGEQVNTIVVDTLSLLPVEVPVEVDQPDPSERARRMSHALRHLRPLLVRTNATLLFIVSTRRSTDLWAGTSAAPGGAALKFYSSIRVTLSPIEQATPDPKAPGRRIVARVIKNKLAAPYKRAEFTLIPRA